RKSQAFNLGGLDLDRPRSDPNPFETRELDSPDLKLRRHSIRQEDGLENVQGGKTTDFVEMKDRTRVGNRLRHVSSPKRDPSRKLPSAAQSPGDDPLQSPRSSRPAEPLPQGMPGPARPDKSRRDPPAARR